VRRFVCFNGKWNVPTLPIQKIQGYTGGGQIPRVVAEEAYKEYSAQYGTSQSLERLCERGGFGAEELAILLYDRIKRLESAALSSSTAPAGPQKEQVP
jgi:hypothetical protein